MNTPKENSPTDQTKNKRYAFAQRQGDDFSCIKIMDRVNMKALYTNTTMLNYLKQKMLMVELPLKFTYDIMPNPNNEDIKSIDFRNYIGDILVEVMEEQLKNGKIIFDK